MHSTRAKVLWDKFVKLHASIDEEVEEKKDEGGWTRAKKGEGGGLAGLAEFKVSRSRKFPQCEFKGRGQTPPSHLAITAHQILSSSSLLNLNKRSPAGLEISFLQSSINNF